MCNHVECLFPRTAQVLQGDWNQPVQVDLSTLQESTKSVSCRHISCFLQKERAGFILMARAVCSGDNLFCRKIQRATCACSTPLSALGLHKPGHSRGSSQKEPAQKPGDKLNIKIIDAVKQHHKRKQESRNQLMIKEFLLFLELVKSIKCM